MAGRTGSSGYRLGVDLGSSFVAAAVNRNGRPEVLRIGNQSDIVPASVGWAGSFVTGEAADDLALRQPQQVLQGLKSRVGDPTPLRLGNTTYPVETLLGQLLGAVVARATRQYGAGPEHLVLSHPAGWGPYRRDALTETGRMVGLGSVSLISDAEAAAAAFSARQPVREGRLLAVYDLGGRTFQASVLRVTLDGFQLLGKPGGFDNLGGVDFDDAIVDHVRERASRALGVLDVDDPAGARAMVRLRRACTLAREQLSREPTATILVPLPTGILRIGLTRAELEDLVRAPVAATVETMRDVLQGAGVARHQLAAMLLVGGTSQMPLVARTLYEELGARAVPADHPRYAVALGAVARSGSFNAAPADAEERTAVVVLPKRPSGSRKTLLWLAILLTAAVLIIVVIGLLAT